MRKIINFAIVMTFQEIRQFLLSGGNICQKYRDLVLSASSKSALAEIISDANGIEFLTSRISTDISMDYAEVASTLRAHVNGRRVFEHGGYTSEIYCGYKGKVTARSTILAVWGSDVTIRVPALKRVEINCDSHSTCRIFLEKGASAACVYWGKKPEVDPDSLGIIRCINKGNKQ